MKYDSPNFQTSPEESLACPSNPTSLRTAEVDAEQTLVNSSISPFHIAHIDIVLDRKTKKMPSWPRAFPLIWKVVQVPPSALKTSYLFRQPNWHLTLTNGANGGDQWAKKEILKFQRLPDQWQNSSSLLEAHFFYKNLR